MHDPLPDEETDHEKKWQQDDIATEPIPSRHCRKTVIYPQTGRWEWKPSENKNDTTARIRR